MENIREEESFRVGAVFMWVAAVAEPQQAER